MFTNIGKIGISNDRKQNIPLEVMTDEGEIVTDTDCVLNKWIDDYSKLYNNDVNASEYDDNKFAIYSKPKPI